MRTRSYVAVWIAFTLLPWLVAAQSSRDAGIFRWDGQRWVQHEGSGTRISVGPDGSPWSSMRAGCPSVLRRHSQPLHKGDWRVTSYDVELP